MISISDESEFGRRTKSKRKIRKRLQNPVSPQFEQIMAVPEILRNFAAYFIVRY